MTTPNEELRLLAQTLEFSDAVRCSIQRAADLLQSQAERIKELEEEIGGWREDQKENIGVAFALQREVNKITSERDELREKYTDTYWALDDAARENTGLRAQLTEIAATEPVAYRWVWKSKPWDIEGWCYTNTPPTLPELQEIEPLFTRPMPANRLTEWKLLMLTTAYEQGVGKGIQRRDCNPYAADTDEHAAWALGYEEGIDKPMPAESNAELVEALKDVAQTLAWMQHGKCRGFSDGLLTTDEALDKARTTLAKYKGAK